jgi:hypothetical protein
VTATTGGSFYPASDPKALTAALTRVKEEIAAPPPAPSLLTPSAGGQILAAPDAGWQAVISGKDSDMTRISCAALPAEGVFAFKDEAPATFSQFQILIPGQGQWVKDFELLAADDSPVGTFRSLGKFTAQNMKMIKSPYQEFTFPAATARYFKLRVLTTYPGDCDDRLTQIRLNGTLVPGGAAKPTPGQTTTPNLLLGAELVGAPNANWAKAIDGKDADSASFSCAALPTEGIFGFKSATSFSRFAIAIPRRGQWPKDIELQAADAAGGPYRSIGKFTTQNMRLFKTPYQEFTFPKTTAKFIKLRILSGFGGDCDDVLPQIRLM